MKWNGNSLICSCWNGDLLEWNACGNGQIESKFQLEEQEIVNSLEVWEGYLFCATRYGLIHRIQTDQATGITSKKTVNLCKNPLSIVNCNGKFLLVVSSLTGELWKIVNFSEGFYCMNIVMETKCRHVCCFFCILMEYSFNCSQWFFGAFVNFPMEKLLGGKNDSWQNN